MASTQSSMASTLMKTGAKRTFLCCTIRNISATLKKEYNRAVIERISALLLFFALAPGAFAQGTCHDASSPGSVTESVSVGINSVDVSGAFAEVTGLTPAPGSSLGVVGLSSTAADALRLPADVSIPAGFPVKITITPTLIFECVADVTLDTSDLPYTTDSRLRLFSAHLPVDSFRDITVEVSEGSYRVRGSQGEFSEFLIVLDERDPRDIVAVKFTRLSDLMTAYSAAIDDTVEATLNGLLASAQASYAIDNIDATKVDIAAFSAAVEAATAAQIPNVWPTPALGDPNVNGLLRSAADTLYFSLARDADLDGVHDVLDNCILAANASQCDTDGDGYGNRCDGDFDNNGTINSFDLTEMRDNFGSAGETDLDCNGTTNSFDLNIIRSMYGGTPGPAAGIP